MLYFILNPNSQSANSTSIWAHIADRLRTEQIEHKVYATQYRGHAEKMARTISTQDPEATIVAVGGDGTIHDILTGLTNLETVTFGLIPSGSGNDFARGMNITKKVDKALDAILHPNTIDRMDIGALPDTNGSRFGVSCGIGFDASVCHEVNASKLKEALNAFHMGNMVYTNIALKQLALYEPGPMKIILDGSETLTYDSCYFIALMNQAYEGGGMKMVPEASALDGSLNVFVCGNIPRAKFAAVLPLTFAGKHTKIKGLAFHQCKEIEIFADKKRPIHLDGESGGIHDHLHVTLEPQKLRIITG